MSLKYLYLARFLTSAYHSHYHDLVKLAVEGRILSLESFWARSEVTQVLETYPEVKVFLDSGAFTLDHQEVKDTQKYLDDYIDFILKYRDRLLGYVNLDDVRDVEISWKNQKYMEEKGVRPIPVYHYGEDFKWIEKYVNEYDYVGVGGVAKKEVLAKDLRVLLDRVFSYLDEKGLSVKMHGFGITSFRFLVRYPWYSVDSTTWLQLSMYGKVMVPAYDTKKKQFDYSVPPMPVCVSDISLVKSSTSTIQHYTIEYPLSVVERIEEYFRVIGVDSEKLKVDSEEREKANAYYYEQFSKSGVLHQQSTEYRKSKMFF